MRPHARPAGGADRRRRAQHQGRGEARASKDFLVIARTDARTALGLDEALRRGEAFLKAGADMMFIESPESEAETDEDRPTFAGVPLVANMVEGGRTPILSSRRTGSLRLQARDFPHRRIPGRRRRTTLRLRRAPPRGSSKAWSGELYPFDDSPA